MFNVEHKVQNIQGWAGKDFGAFPLLAFAVAGKGKDFSLPAGQGISLPATKSVADEKQFSLPATESFAGELKNLLLFLAGNT